MNQIVVSYEINEHACISPNSNCLKLSHTPGDSTFNILETSNVSHCMVRAGVLGLGFGTFVYYTSGTTTKNKLSCKRTNKWTSLGCKLSPN